MWEEIWFQILGLVLQLECRRRRRILDLGPCSHPHDNICVCCTKTELAASRYSGLNWTMF